MADAAAQPQQDTTAEKSAPLKPSERQWVVQTAQRLPDGQVVPDHRAMEEEMLRIAAILQRIGGIVTIASRRLEVAPGQIETTSIVVRSQAFAPLDRGADVEAEVPEVEQPPEGSKRA